SPAGDANRDRGYSRRDDFEGLDRRAAGDRLDQAARPPQGARASADFWHHRGLPVAFRTRRGRRPAWPRRAQGLRPARRPPTGRLRGADAVGRSGAARGRGPARARRPRPWPRAASRALGRRIAISGAPRKLCGVAVNGSGPATHAKAYRRGWLVLSTAAT